MNWTPVERPTETEAEAAGYDAGKNGSNTTNTHFRFFGSRYLSAAWGRGKRRAESEGAAAGTIHEEG